MTNAIGLDISFVYVLLLLSLLCFSMVLLKMKKKDKAIDGKLFAEMYQLEREYISSQRGEFSCSEAQPAHPFRSIYIRREQYRTTKTTIRT